MNVDELATDLQADRMIPIEGVCCLTGLAKSTVFKKIAAGEIPSGYKFGTGKSAARRWKESTIRQYVNDNAVKGPKR